MLKNKNIKKFITDMFFNTFSFGIYILAQQIILMPIMSKLLNQAEYANYIIYISIFAIISNTLGSELGITRQVRDDKSNASEYNRILLVLLPIIVVTSNILLFFLKYDFINNVLLTIPIVLANIRLYSVSYFRMNKDFKKVLPTFEVGSPAKVESGIGDIAIYIYILKNLPYTVNIIMNDKTVINNPPINVTAHKGIDSKKPQLSIAFII